jgi:predicted nuclease with TOPRIM domain
MDILNPRQTFQTFAADSYNKEILDELKEMRKENTKMREDLKVANKQIIRLNTKMNNRFQKYDETGTPDVRAA